MKNRNKHTIEQKEDQKEVSKKTSVSRRQFLKKTAYATPSLIILGNLPTPVMANNNGSLPVTDNNNGSGGSFGGGFN